MKKSSLSPVANSLKPKPVSSSENEFNKVRSRISHFFSLVLLTKLFKLRFPFSSSMAIKSQTSGLTSKNTLSNPRTFPASTTYSSSSPKEGTSFPQRTTITTRSSKASSKIISSIKTI